MLDILHLFTFLGAVQGIFFSLLLFGLPKGNRTANHMLALFLLVFSISMLGAVAYVSRWILKVPHLALWHTPFAAITSSPFLLYMLAMTQKDFRFKAWHAALFLPFIAVIVWQIPFFCLPAAEKRHILETSYSSLPGFWKAVFVFSAVVDFAGLVASYLVVLRHERVVREVYSSPLNKTMRWTRHFLYSGILIFGLCILMSFMDITMADSISNLLFSVNIYIFGYRAMRQPEIFSDVRADTLPEKSSLPLVRQQSEKYKKSGFSEAKAKALMETLERLMETEKPYLDPALNLQQLAGYLKMPPHQVSQLLNQFCGESFSDYVNRYRVEHFKKAVAESANAHLSLLAVAFDSGFNSKAAFNAVFKKMTGLTPSEFKESADQEVFPGK